MVKTIRFQSSVDRRVVYEIDRIAIQIVGSAKRLPIEMSPRTIEPSILERIQGGGG